MTTDNKTLADVQPGGRVRLGDSRSTRAATFLRQYLTYLRSSPRQGLRPRWCDVYEALEIAIEALSAQPSPGGQGDDLAVELLATELERDGNDQAASAIRSGDTTYGMKLLHAALRAITAALAARQPVGEVSVKKEDANNYCLILRALGMEEEGDPVAEVQALIEARDRQPVGEPPMEMRICELRHVSLKPNRPYIFTVDANCANCRADAAYAMGHTDTRPAQAVDLGQFRDSVVQAISNVSYMTGYGPAYEKLTELLALIDSQAVGNGN